MAIPISENVIYILLDLTDYSASINFIHLN